MNEQEKQALIEYCEAVISAHVQYGGDSDEEAVYRIALAALTAEPVDRVVDDGCDQHIGGVKHSDRVNCAWPVGTKFYAAPPAVNLAELVLGGWKLVPIEMTDDIGEAIAMEAGCCGGIALDIYDAALRAAPEPPSC